MSRGLLFAGLLCAGLFAPAASAAAPPCPEHRVVVYPVADLVVPADTRPVTVAIGKRAKPARPRKQLPTTQDRLIRQITSQIAPGTWGPGAIEYRAEDLSLVVSHTAAVQKQVAALLGSLRPEPEVSVSLEVRVVGVSEQTFERIGVEYEPAKPLDEGKIREVLEVAQGDRRTNILQAPKVTCSDRQRVHFRMDVGGTPVALRVTPVVSADRRSVRLSVRLTRDGTPHEKVKAVLADGHSIALPGWSTTRETRQEYGPPVLSKVPYINRLFKNVGIGREREKVFLMVTPRVIIQKEEELAIGIPFTPPVAP